MGRLSQILILVITVAASSSACAASSYLVDRAVRAAGLTEQADAFGDRVADAMRKAARRGVPRDVAGPLIRAAERMDWSGPVLSAARSRLSQDFSDDELNGVLQWYQSDLGRRVAAAEVEAARPESNSAALASRAQELMEDSERVSLAQRFDRTLGMTDRILRMGVDTTVAVAAGTSVARNPDQPLNTDALRATAEDRLAGQRDQFHQMALISLLLTYRDLSIEDLYEYEAFLDDPAAARFIEVTTSVLSEGVALSLDQWAQELGKAVAGSAR